MDIGWKIISTAGSVAAGFIASRIVEKAWSTVTGHSTPNPDEDSLESNLAELVAFSAVAGTVNTLIKGLVMRQAQSIYARSGRSVPVKVKKA